MMTSNNPPKATNNRPRTRQGLRIREENMGQRDLKFRVYCDIEKRMLTDVDLLQNAVDETVLGSVLSLVPRGDRTVMQFTGLLDKNGVEIYEGDILRSHGQVIWNDVEHRWSAIDLTWNDRREWHDLDYLTDPFEVIGNIHEPAAK
jgi:hypothetical protein